MIFAGNLTKRIGDMASDGGRVTWHRSFGMSLIAMGKGLVRGSYIQRPIPVAVVR